LGIPNFVTLPGFAAATSRLDHTDDGLLAGFASLPLDFDVLALTFIPVLDNRLPLPVTGD